MGSPSPTPVALQQSKAVFIQTEEATFNKMSDDEPDTQSPEEQLLARHRQERKELQGKIIQLKKSSNKDKKKKKEMGEQIEKMEKDMEIKHTKELEELKMSEKITSLESNLAEVSVSCEKETEKNNKYCARNLEAAKIKSILKERNMKMHEI